MRGIAHAAQCRRQYAGLIWSAGVQFTTIPILCEHFKLSSHFGVRYGVTAKQVAKSPVKVGS